MKRQARTIRIAAALLVATVILSSAAPAQHPGMPGMAMESDTSRGVMSGPLGIPHTRMGSGTSWLPDGSPMNAYHVMAGAWTLMLHGQVFLEYDDQLGRRGDTQVGSTNWGMIMAMRPVGGGLLHLHGMMSLEPWTIGVRGYPLLLQSGESADGKPLHDRQHPHDLFMEIAVMYERPVSSKLAASLYLAPVGEPAVGPVAFMHRPSAEGDPFATLAHHWQDATHITYGVLTAGIFTRRWKLEGSVFNGREPDEDRTDFDFRRLDSYAARLNLNPSDRLALNVSYGFLKSPEGLEPTVSQDRIVASLLYTRPANGGHLSTALIFGANHRSDRDGLESSLVLESNLHFHDTENFFGRLTYVRKDAAELSVGILPPDQPLDIYALTLGYVHQILRAGQVRLGIGGRAEVSRVPQSLEPVYGTRVPIGFAVYLRIMPGSAEMTGPPSH
jgi:hypothetical protein